MKNQRKPKGNDRKSVQNVRKVEFFLEKTKKIDKKKQKKYPQKNSTWSNFCICLGGVHVESPKCEALTLSPSNAVCLAGKTTLRKRHRHQQEQQLSALARAASAAGPVHVPRPRKFQKPFSAELGLCRLGGLTQAQENSWRAQRGFLRQGPKKCPIRVASRVGKETKSWTSWGHHEAGNLPLPGSTP